MTVRPAWLLPLGQTREDTRLAPVGTWSPEDEIRTRDGVIPGGDPFAATGVAAMQLQVGVGRATVQGTTAQGAYPVAVDAPETVTLTDGNDQFARVDSVIVRVYDGLFDDSDQALARVEVIEGEPSATPTAPTLPPCSLRLWDVTVPAGASAGVGGIDWSSALADRRRYTVAAGGIIPRGWGLSFDGAYDGQYRDADGTLERWNGTDGVWETYRPPEPAAETLSGGVTTATGWSLNSFAARRRSGVVQILGYWTRTGANLPATPNLGDTLVATIPAGWRPVVLVEAVATNGYGFGSCAIGSDGRMTIRAWAGGGPDLNTSGIERNTNVRVAATFVQ
ncbi:hypothetical protein [Streptomyces sp. FR-008]|uniref:hypothetical protein n=1 Tax=Streptomyces sp. FR-008 TaxID=206662 RepID=UPI000722667D|nr:hypothetical protein [Streptomyces sp. FR-008]ALM38237.1 LigA protein [Streptomyces sp. FR-008]KAF0795879.1 hypothetical protein P405_00530 [Streptomyces sp. FR-008]